MESDKIEEEGQVKQEDKGLNPPPGNPITSSTVVSINTDSEVKTSEEGEINQDAPKQEKVFNDEDIIQHSQNIVQGKLDSSREQGFKDVPVSYTDLELIFRTIAAALNRTHRCNSIATQLKARDEALVNNVKITQSTIEKHKAHLQLIENQFNAIRELSLYFMPKNTPNPNPPVEQKVPSEDS